MYLQGISEYMQHRSRAALSLHAFISACLTFQLYSNRMHIIMDALIIKYIYVMANIWAEFNYSNTLCQRLDRCFFSRRAAKTNTITSFVARGGIAVQNFGMVSTGMRSHVSYLLPGNVQSNYVDVFFCCYCLYFLYF